MHTECLSLADAARNHTQIYLNQVQRILNHGTFIDNGRTEENFISAFNAAMTFDLVGGNVFPLISARSIPCPSIFGELIGFLRGVDNVAEFEALRSPVWRKNANDPAWQANPFCKGDGDLGETYGVQMRARADTRHLQKAELTESRVAFLKGLGFEQVAQDVECGGTFRRHIDQVQNIIDSLRRPDSYDRRMVLDNWNPAAQAFTALPACHCMVVFQRVPVHAAHTSLMRRNYESLFGQEAPGGTVYRLNAHVTIRSNDFVLGAPFNIASYAALIHLFALASGLCVVPGELGYTAVDAHIYEDHIDLAKQMVAAGPNSNAIPRLVFADTVKNNLFDSEGRFSPTLYTDDLRVEDYEYNIKSPKLNMAL